MDSDIESNLSAEVLALLRCPVSGQPLSMAPPELVKRVSGGDFSQALLRADGALLYPVRDGIPILLPDAGILLTEAGRT